MIRYTVHGIRYRYTVHGIRYTVYGTRYTVYGIGIRYTVHGIRYTVHGIRYTVYGIRYRYTVYGTRYTVHGIRYTHACLRPSVLRLCAANALWLAAYCYAILLFLMEIPFVMKPNFSGAQLGRKTRAGCNR